MITRRSCIHSRTFHGSHISRGHGVELSGKQSNDLPLEDTAINRIAEGPDYLAVGPVKDTAGGDLHGTHKNSYAPPSEFR